MAFVTYRLWQHWGEVGVLVADPPNVFCLGLAGAVVLVAHGWSGWVWGGLLQGLGQPVAGLWVTLVYLRTNVWKYLPGNVWHFYGRLQALREAGLTIAAASLAVGLEPLLMAAAALIVGLAYPTPYWPWQLLVPGLVMVAFQPRWINSLLRRCRPQAEGGLGVKLQGYPLAPLAGLMVFVLLRGLGFVLVIQSLQPLAPVRWPLLLSRFSLAWLVGLVVPGAPGGVGVFEAVALVLLPAELTPRVELASLALYRLVSTLVEILAALLALSLQAWGIGTLPPDCPPVYDFDLRSPPRR